MIQIENTSFSAPDMKWNLSSTKRTFFGILCYASSGCWCWQAGKWQVATAKVVAIKCRLLIKLETAWMKLQSCSSKVLDIRNRLIARLCKVKKIENKDKEVCQQKERGRCVRPVGNLFPLLCHFIQAHTHTHCLSFSIREGQIKMYAWLALICFSLVPGTSLRWSALSLHRPNESNVSSMCAGHH